MSSKDIAGDSLIELSEARSKALGRFFELCHMSASELRELGKTLSKAEGEVTLDAQSDNLSVYAGSKLVWRREI